MGDLLGALPQLVEVVTKGGVVGVLLIVCCVMGWEIRRLRWVSAQTFAQRDRWRLAYTIVKAAADAAGAKYDLRDLDDLVKADGSPA